MKDKGVGDFTYFLGKPPSVIDYGVFSQVFLPCVDFQVMELVGSNHMPMRIALGKGEWVKNWNGNFIVRIKVDNKIGH